MSEIKSSKKIRGWTGIGESLQSSTRDLAPGSKVYFMGIGGTGMTAVAGLMKEAGYTVDGSDKPMYPPMSTLLAELEIKVRTPYSIENVKSLGSESVVVVGNALSRGHEELEAALANLSIVYTSFPGLLCDTILSERKNLVVTGTHGKTTTSSLAAHVLNHLGLDPGFMIGGIPRDFARGFALGKKNGPFVIEGDEYDTAFFDKTPKFLKYRPHWLIINNIEYDHVDIYRDFDHVLEQFVKISELVSQPSRIIVNLDNPGVGKLLEHTQLENEVSGVGKNPSKMNTFSVKIIKSEVVKGSSEWVHEFELSNQRTLSIVSRGLAGEYNGYNAAAVLASTLQILCDTSGCKIADLDYEEIEGAFSSFTGVKRRLELLGNYRGAIVFEDFAHHPTAVSQLITAFRSAYPDRKLSVAFEATNATGRRRVFLDDFARAFSGADRVYIGPSPLDIRIPEAERMNTGELAEKIGTKAKSYETHEAIYEDLLKQIGAGDALIFMSPSSFGGIQHRLVGSSS